MPRKPAKPVPVKPASAIAYGALGPFVASPADWYMTIMDEGNDLHRLAAVKVALEVDPDNIEALLAKAEYIKKDKAYCLEVLKHAVRVGSRLWAPVEKEYGAEMSWWDFPGTRPYMRAIFALGEASEEHGDRMTAAHCYESLIRMNTRDPLGARFRLERVRPSAGSLLRA